MNDTHDKEMREAFLSRPEWCQRDIVNGYRKIRQLNEMFGGQDAALSALEEFLQCAFPAFAYESTRDENGDYNDRYQNLYELAASYVEDERYFDIVTKRYV